MSRLTIGSPFKLRPHPSVRTGLRLMRACSPTLYYGIGAAAVLAGLLPIAYTLLTGVLLAAVPAAVDSGSLYSADGHRVLWLVAATGALFALQTTVSTFNNAFREGFRARFAAYRREYIMRATLSFPGIAHLEDSDYLDALSLASTREWPDPGAFATGVYGYLSTRVSAFASAVVVAIAFHWWIALLLMAAWAFAGHIFRIGQATGFTEGRHNLRRANYFRELSYEPDAAKEIRVFNLRDWVEEQFHNSWYEDMTVVWKRRGKRMWIRLGIAALIFITNFIGFAVLANDALKGAISIALILVVARSMYGISFFCNA